MFPPGIPVSSSHLPPPSTHPPSSFAQAKVNEIKFCKPILFLVCSSLFLPGICQSLEPAYPYSNSVLQQLLKDNEKFFAVQSGESGALLTRTEVKNGIALAHIRGLEFPGISFQTPVRSERNPQAGSMVTGNKRILDSQTWALHQTIGFPYINKTFTPVYSLRDVGKVLSSLGVKDSFASSPWKLTLSRQEKDVKYYRFQSLFKNLCLAERPWPQSAVLDDCDTSNKNLEFTFLKR